MIEKIIALLSLLIGDNVLGRGTNFFMRWFSKSKEKKAKLIEKKQVEPTDEGKKRTIRQTAYSMPIAAFPILVTACATKNFVTLMEDAAGSKRLFIGDKRICSQFSLVEIEAAVNYLVIDGYLDAMIHSMQRDSYYPSDKGFDFVC